jgi:hypothetical protein
VPAGQSGIPTQLWRDAAQTWPGQQQWPALSALTSWPAGQLKAHDSPSARSPAGHCGMPTQAERLLAQA